MFKLLIQLRYRMVQQVKKVSSEIVAVDWVEGKKYPKVQTKYNTQFIWMPNRKQPPQPIKQIKIYYLHHHYTSNFIKKLIKSQQNYICLIPPEMGQFKIKQVHRVINRIFNQKFQRTIKKTKQKIFDQLMVIKIQTYHTKLKFRILSKKPSIPPKNQQKSSFYPYPSQDPMLVPIEIYFSFFHSKNLQINGITVPQLNNTKIYPLINVWPCSNNGYLNLWHQYISNQKFQEGVEVGCGTGVLSFIWKKHNKKASIIAIDKNDQALVCTQTNRQILGYQNIRTLKMDIIKEKKLIKKTSLIFSNPPWITTKPPYVHDYSKSQSNYDRKQYFIRNLFEFSKINLQDDGKLVLIYSDLSFLLGIQKIDRIEQLAKQNGFKISKTKKQKYKIQIEGKQDALFGIKQKSHILLYQFIKI